MSKGQVSTRESKRSKFVKQSGKSKATGPRPLYIILAALAIVVGGGAALALSRPKPVGAATEIRGSAPVPATHNHAPYPQVVAEDGEIRLPTSLFADGKAHHYTYMAGEQPIEFFVLQSQDGVVRAAFNACDVCYLGKLGYVQDGDHMVCVNCGRRFPADQINVVQGGCNPAPLERSVVGDLLVIKTQDIVQGARFF